MASPIETNTEELQEILQQVYDLPNRSGGGGSSEPDLILYFDDDYFNYHTSDSIDFDQSKAVTTFQKILANEPVSVIAVSTQGFGSSDGYTGPKQNYCFSSYVNPVDNYLGLKFLNLSYFTGSTSSGYQAYLEAVEVTIDVDVNNGTATWNRTVSGSNS